MLSTLLRIYTFEVQVDSQLLKLVCVTLLLVYVPKFQAERREEALQNDVQTRSGYVDVVHSIWFIRDRGIRASTEILAKIRDTQY